jgi:hypothetical protein
MGANARRTVLDRFTVDQMVKATLQAYKSVLASGFGPPMDADERR